MAYLRSRPAYMVVKVAGENLSDDKDYFVATNKSYVLFEDAVKIAADLAEKTPENRYYVTMTVAGFMTHAPRKEMVQIVKAVELPGGNSLSTK